MQTLWYHYAAQASNLDVSLLFMNLGLETGDAETETSRTRYLQTFGTYVTYQPESGNWLPVQAAFYYQTGKNKNAQSVSAFMASVKAAYAIDKQWSVSLGYDYLSGSDGEGDKFKAFDPLYGTHHKSMERWIISMLLPGRESLPVCRMPSWVLTSRHPSR